MKLLENAKLAPHLISAKCLIESKRKSHPQPFGIDKLDRALDGGIVPGLLYEFGMPLGFEGRSLVLSLLKNLTSKKIKVMWILPRNDLTLNPAHFYANQIDLTQIRFSITDNPIEDLKPIFFETIFQLIVMDSPALYKKDAFSFLSAQARVNNLNILILRNYLLKNEIGNVWTPVRVNCFPSEKSNEGEFKIIRGAQESGKKYKLNN